MISKIEQKINDFIKNIRVLAMAKNGLEVLQYIAQHNNSKVLAQFNQAYNLIDDDNKHLMNSIGSKKEGVMIAKNINEAIIIINDIPDQITNKTELLDMLRDCATSFAPEEMSNAFFAISQNESLLSQQILLLDTIWIEYCSN